MNIKPTKAVILAAGKGTRMGSLTQTLPKPMVEVQGKPILEYILTGLRDHAGIKDFFIITGYCAEVVENYFQDGSKFDIRCTYGRQIEQNGTGKAPEIAASWVGSDAFFLSYGDILIHTPEYGNMCNTFHSDGLISVKMGEKISLGGAVVFDEQFYLKDLIEKAAPGTVDTPWYNAGIYIFTPKIYRYTAQLKLSARNEYELTDAIRAMAQDGLKIQGYEIQKNWVDVRDPEVLSQLNQKTAPAA